MDINQVAKMIEWLDEERRRDKTIIAQLEEHITQQEETIGGLTRRLNGVESDQSATRGTIFASIREGEMMDHIRGTIQTIVDEVETRRLNAEREAQRRDDSTREGLAKAMQDTTARIDKIEETAEEMGAARVERDRFASAMGALQQRVEDVAKKLEDPERRITFLEEQRRQDARRLSEAQSELPDLQRDLDGQKAKLALLEDMSLRNEKKLLEVQNTERDRREQIQQFVEQQTLFVQQRDQRVDELTHNFAHYDEEMRRNLERFETWAETYRLMKKALEDFERVGERLERRINEVAETQRLSEERFRQEWNSWNDDDQKRWKQFTLTNDESWRLHDKEYDQFRAKVTGIDEQIPVIQDHIDRLWGVERAKAEMYREQYQAIITDREKPAEKAVPRSASNGHGRK